MYGSSVSICTVKEQLLLFGRVHPTDNSSEKQATSTRVGSGSRRYRVVRIPSLTMDEAKYASKIYSLNIYIYAKTHHSHTGTPLSTSPRRSPLPSPRDSVKSFCVWNITRPVWCSFSLTAKPYSK